MTVPAVQLELVSLHPCDICQGRGVEEDPETGLDRRCRVCAGTGQLGYDPAGCAANPFTGMAA